MISGAAAMNGVMPLSSFSVRSIRLSFTAVPRFG